jgi:dethiobiotin synthetase
MRGLFVTGTDTGVGKTVCSAALLSRYRRDVPVRYWKPIQTGIEQDDDTAAVRALACAADPEIFDKGVRLPRPLSPHLAARLAGERIELGPLAKLAVEAEPPRPGAQARASDAPPRAVSHAPQTGPAWIVEGAGGLLVPINERDTMADWIAMLALPVVIAARSTLGTINHTLLTLEALRSRSLRAAGVIMIGPPNRDNREAIERYGAVPVLGEMPVFDPLTHSALDAWSAVHLDPGGLLLEFLR